MRVLALLALLADCHVGPAPAPVSVELLAPPAAPRDISISIVDRRKTSMEVCWTAPAAELGRRRVRTFEVVYAKRPIDAGNFDDPTITMRVPFNRTPAGPGARECLLVDGLYIENAYYFAVRAIGDGRPAPADMEPNT